jgi:hypothetical protein
MNEVAVEVGIFFIAAFVCMILLLIEVGGDLSLIPRWLVYRKLNIYTHRERNPRQVEIHLRKFTYLFVYLPVIAIIFWNTLLYAEESSEL